MRSLSTKIHICISPDKRGAAENKVGFLGEEEGNLNRTPFGVTLTLTYSLNSCHVTELQIPIG